MQIDLPRHVLGDWLLVAEHAFYWWWLFVLRDQPCLGMYCCLELYLSDQKRNFCSGGSFSWVLGLRGPCEPQSLSYPLIDTHFIFPQSFLLSPPFYHTSWIPAAKPRDDCFRNRFSILFGRIVRQLFTCGEPAECCTEPRCDSYETQALHRFTRKYHLRGESDRKGNSPFRLKTISQFSLRGRWPAERYQKILEIQL
jgi:hypothetical protein